MITGYIVRVRWYTEDVNKEQSDMLIGGMLFTFNGELPGLTVIKGRGVWKGGQENSLVIEFIGDMDYDKAHEIAEYIKGVNGQESVLMTIEPILAELV